MGSPPLVRERQIKMFFDARYRRITPARAGKTIYCRNWHRTPWDHPRSCGKDGVRSQEKMGKLGSPPLVRERLMFPPFGLLNCGITPARAGKTAFAADYLGNPRDHPRSCGKDVEITNLNVYTPGSPPLVRERLLCMQLETLYMRITPARAGKTQILHPLHGILWDHPRSCGKDLRRRRFCRHSIGSPPLVRERPL